MDADPLYDQPDKKVFQEFLLGYDSESLQHSPNCHFCMPTPIIGQQEV